MALTLVTAPIVEAVPLSKLQAHLRVEDGDDTAYLTHCLATAIAQFDGADARTAVHAASLGREQSSDAGDAEAGNLG